jgi:hypothetical protein
MKPQNLILWGLGLFAAYKLFVKPKTTTDTPAPTPQILPSQETQQGGNVLVEDRALPVSYGKPTLEDSTATASIYDSNGQLAGIY